MQGHAKVDAGFTASLPLWDKLQQIKTTSTEQEQNSATINVMLGLTQALYSLPTLDKSKASHVHSHRVCITKMFAYNEVVKL